MKLSDFDPTSKNAKYGAVTRGVVGSTSIGKAALAVTPPPKGPALGKTSGGKVTSSDGKRDLILLAVAAGLVAFLIFKK